MAIPVQAPTTHLPLDADAPNLRLLWIDDEPTVPESCRLSLEANGVDLTTALDAATGVAMASQQRYDVIILDLRLGEAWGLDALRDLRSAGVTASVMILTAYGESDSALQAGRLGAVAYHHKPLVGRKLLQAILDAAKPEPAPAPRPSLELPRPGGIVMRILSDSEHSGGTEALTSRLAQALADPTLTFFEFLALLKYFSQVRVVSRDSGRHGENRTVASRRALTSLACLCWEDVDTRVAQAVWATEAAGSQWRSLRADRVATAIGTDASTLWRILQRSLGLSFGGLMRTVVMRRAVADLAANEDHVRQIAFHLGYEHHSSFDRDFRRCLGISPSGFRTLLKQAGRQAGRSGILMAETQGTVKEAVQDQRLTR
jgi:CheY-like chemotaxis protein